jgi:hypothetical protein
MAFLEGLHQLLEAVLGLGVHELVVLELLDLARHVLRQPLEELALALRDVAEHLGELGLVVARARLARLAGLARLGRRALGRALPLAGLPAPAGLLAAVALLGLALAALRGAFGLAAGLAGRGVRAALLVESVLEALIEGAALHVHDLFEALLDVLERGAEVEAVEGGAALLAELLEQVAQALHALAHGVAHAALHQVPQRVLQVPEVHQVVCEGFQQVVRVERGDLLAAVPFRVAIGECHAVFLPLRAGGLRLPL